MDFEIQRENNIIKNIANEVAYECSQTGFEVPHELARYMVKLKLLNPKNGFTASTVMPRSQTQHLVELVVEDLKQDTPSMDCIRMQVYWSTIEMNTNELKNEHVALVAEKAEGYLNEIMALDQDNVLVLQKLLTQYILAHQNLKNMNNQTNFRETMGALHSIAKYKELAHFYDLKTDEKIDKMKTYVKRVIGIRLYLKHIGKAGDGLEEVKDLTNKIDMGKEEILRFMKKLSMKIDDLRDVIMTVIPMDFFKLQVKTGEVQLPPECTIKDVLYLKKILAIMLQHNIYLSDILSKMEEIDATVNSLFREYENTLDKLKLTIRDREAVPTVEVFDDFDKVGDLWEKIESYYYCFDAVYNIAKKLENINQAKYFVPSLLEKLTVDKLNEMLPKSYGGKKSTESSKLTNPSSNIALQNFDEFFLEFNGFCAWTLYFTDGLLLPGNADAGICQFQDKYYAFADGQRHELWTKNPHYYLSEIYEYLRVNPEMIDLLNAYENLYNIRTVELIQDTDRKVPSHAQEIQTEVHPIPSHWDKDYTFSLWELKKRALTLSRIVKCVTKSVQTVSPHSHYRASIGLLAAPDKDKEVQTKRDSSCVHSTVSNYLYGLRGHREDKFRVVELTRPPGETYERKIILGEEDPCRDRKKPPDTREMTCTSSEFSECYKASIDNSDEYKTEF